MPLYFSPRIGPFSYVKRVGGQPKSAEHLRAERAEALAVWRSRTRAERFAVIASMALLALALALVFLAMLLG